MGFSNDNLNSARYAEARYDRYKARYETRYKARYAEVFLYLMAQVLKIVVQLLQFKLELPPGMLHCVQKLKQQYDRLIELKHGYGNDVIKEFFEELITFSIFDKRLDKH